MKSYKEKGQHIMLELLYNENIIVGGIISKTHFIYSKTFLWELIK